MHILVRYSTRWTRTGATPLVGEFMGSMIDPFTCILKMPCFRDKEKAVLRIMVSLNVGIHAGRAPWVPHA